MIVVDVLASCPTCDAPVPPGATRCECGERLTPRSQEPHPYRDVPHGCKCGGTGTCTACTLASYDGGAI